MRRLVFTQTPAKEYQPTLVRKHDSQGIIVIILLLILIIITDNNNNNNNEETCCHSNSNEKASTNTDVKNSKRVSNKCARNLNLITLTNGICTIQHLS